MRRIAALSAAGRFSSVAQQPRQPTGWFGVERSGRVCHVQLKTAAPLGEDFKGPFPSRKTACQEANDDSASDQQKCWTYGGGTVSGYAKDGVILPGSKKRR